MTDASKPGGTDPYGHLEYAIGGADDFWCFDFCIHNDRTVTLHAVINSETGSFIMNAEEPVRVPEGEAVEYMTHLVGRALEWCADNEVRHSNRGWNQDPMYVVRMLRYYLNPVGRRPGRIRRKWQEEI